MYDALIEAGATEAKARKAAEVIADYDSRLAAIDAKLSVALWAGGLLFALPRPRFLTWLTRCDLWLEARFLPKLDVSEAATLYRAGLSIDEVLERQQGERP
jgi:hypothetical protein